MNFRMSILLVVIFLSVCCFSPYHTCDSTIVEVGSASSDNVWIYLCGLTSDFYSSQEVENRVTLDQIGHTPEEALKTYSYILKVLNKRNISGFIGFSNGGFFLNKLAQLIELERPIISIGSAGYLDNVKLKNELYLLIG